MFEFIFTIILISIVYFSCLYRNRNRKKWVNEYISKLNGPTVLPIFGNVLELACSVPELLMKTIAYSHVYKSPVKVWMFHVPMVGIYNPEDVQLVCKKALDKHPSLKSLADLIGNGLITLNGDKWKRSRRILSSAFNMTVLSKSFLDIFNRQNELLIEELRMKTNTGIHFDLWPYIFKFAFNTIRETSIGHTEQLDEEKFTLFKKMFHKALIFGSKRLYMPWLQPSFLFKIYLYFKGCLKLPSECQEYPVRILQERRKKLNESKQNADFNLNEKKFHQNMVDMLMNIRETKDQFTDEEITHEVLTVFFAGSETTAVTVCFTLLMLAIHEDIQDKVYNELYEVFGDSDRPPNLDDLSALIYLEQCIKETLRRFAIVPATMRVSSENITLSKGQVIPAGVNICVAFALVHLDNNLYPNAEKWNPAHFDPEKVASRPTCSFFPFGYGPRTCIGGKYAMLAIKAQLSTILRHFKLSTDVKEDEVILDIDILIRSLHGYNVKLYDRRSTNNCRGLSEVSTVSV